MYNTMRGINEVSPLKRCPMLDSLGSLSHSEVVRGSLFLNLSKHLLLHEFYSLNSHYF